MYYTVLCEYGIASNSLIFQALRSLRAVINLYVYERFNAFLMQLNEIVYLPPQRKLSNNKIILRVT